MGKKKDYESPLIKRTQVETESGFCAASIIEKPNNKGISTQGHEVGVEIDASKPLDQGGVWDDKAWN